MHIRETFNKSYFLSIRKKILIINLDSKLKNLALGIGYFTLVQSTAKDRLHRLNSRIAGIAPHQNYMRYDVTHLIHYLLPKIGRRLAPEVVYRIRVRIKAGEGVLAITKAIKVSRPTVYKI